MASSTANRRTFEFAKVDDGLAEWKSKIKQLQEDADADNQAEQRRLEMEIAQSRIERSKRRNTGVRRSLGIGDIPDDLRGIADQQQTQSDALRRLSGGPDPKSSVITPAAVPTSEARHGYRPPAPSARPISLAAFMGSDATGPRLNKPLPQVDAHDPTMFDPIHTSLRPTSVISGIHLPGMGATPLKFSTNMTTQSTSVAAEPLPSVKAPKLLAGVRRPSPPQEPLREGSSRTDFQSNKDSFNKLRKSSNPERELPIGVPSTPAYKEATSVVPNTQPRGTGPRSEKLMNGTHGTHGVVGSSKPGPPSSRLMMIPTDINSSSSPSKSPPSTVPITSLSRPIQPTPIAQPLFVPKTNPSPAFLRSMPPKEQTPSLTRLQGRGFVEQRIKASALFEARASQSDGELPRSVGAREPKKTNVLSRWTGQPTMESEIRLHFSSSTPTVKPTINPTKPKLAPQDSHLSSAMSTGPAPDSAPRIKAGNGSAAATFKRQSGTASDQESSRPPGLSQSIQQRPISLAQQISSGGTFPFPSNRQVDAKTQARDLTPERLPGLSSMVTNANNDTHRRLARLPSLPASSRRPELAHRRERTRSVHFTPDQEVAEREIAPPPVNQPTALGSQQLIHLTKGRARKPRKEATTTSPNQKLPAGAAEVPQLIPSISTNEYPGTPADTKSSPFTKRKPVPVDQETRRTPSDPSPALLSAKPEDGMASFPNPWTATASQRGEGQAGSLLCADSVVYPPPPAATRSLVDVKVAAKWDAPSSVAKQDLRPILTQPFPEISSPWIVPASSVTVEPTVDESLPSHSGDRGNPVNVWAGRPPIGPKPPYRASSAVEHVNVRPLPMIKKRLPGLASTSPVVEQNGEQITRNITSRSPPRLSRIPSTGSRPTVMDIAQNLHDSEGGSFVESPSIRLPALSQEPHQEPESQRLDAKSAAVSTGKPDVSTPIETQRFSIPDVVPEMPAGHPELTLVMPDLPKYTPPSEEETDESRVDVKAAIANWGASQPPAGIHARPLSTSGSQQLDRRRSTYEKYASIILPPLKEEKTPNPTPAGSLFKTSEQHSIRPDMSSALEALENFEKVQDQSRQSGQSTGLNQPAAFLSPSDGQSKQNGHPSSDPFVHLHFDDNPLPSFAFDPLTQETRPTSDSLEQTTISVEVFHIAGTNASSISREPHIFYESEIMAVVRRAKTKSSGLVSTTVWGWHGRTSAGEKESRKLQDLAHRFGTNLIECSQGSEPSDIVEVLGGILVTRQGSRAHWAAENTAMHCVRAISGCVFIDQVDLEIKNLCSAYSYCISVLDALYVWHGRGSSLAERKAASTYASSLESDSMTVIEFDEGDEDEMFWMMLGEEPYASSTSWSVKPKFESQGLQPRLYRVDATRSTPVTAIRPFSAKDIDNQSVLVYDGLFELFIIVGADVRDQRANIRLAVAVTKNISAITADSRPFPAPAHVLILPSQIPLDLRSRFRYMDEEQLNGGSIPEHMNLLSLCDATDHLTTTSWKRSILLDDTFLPLGIGPSALKDI